MADLSPGSVLGERFEVVGVLGRGGMATVYLARDRVRDSRIALKVLHAHLAEQPTARARLRREVEAAARIRHPNALVASELFELDGQLALSLPLHEGETLGERAAERGPMTAEQLWRLGEDLAGALAEAHRAGVLHRDLAPGNVMLDGQGRGALMDFGLARLDDLASRSATAAVGTAGFTAPEVLEGGRSSAGADLYGLGGVLYLAAAGKAPFAASSALATLKRQADGSFTPLRELRPELPVALCQVIESMLARDPAERPESAAAARDAFARRVATHAGARPAPRPQASAPPSPAPQLLSSRPALPKGRAVLVLRERGDMRHRRRRFRRGQLREKAGLEGLVVGIAEKVEVAVRAAAGLPAGRTPERLLVDAVGAEAGLPQDALVEPRALMESHFRLVDGVSPEVAERLAETAEGLGFRAYVLNAREGGSAGGAAAAVLALALVAAGAAMLAGPLDVVLVPMMVVALGVVALITALSQLRGRRPAAVDRLPLAFSADLAASLAPGFALPEGVAPTPTVAASPVAAPAAPPSLAVRTAERLSALEQAIQAQAGRLPAPAVLDLGETLNQLRQRARAIELEIQRVDADLSLIDPRQEEEAAARVGARLERLRTRQSAGDGAVAAEIAILERALEAHQSRLAAAEGDEQRRVQLEAALLEIGGAADRCRRGVVEDPDPARSVDDLLGQLKRDQARASESIDEVTRRRRSAAAARQRQG